MLLSLAATMRLQVSLLNTRNRNFVHMLAYGCHVFSTRGHAEHRHAASSLALHLRGVLSHAQQQLHDMILKQLLQQLLPQASAVIPP